MHDLPCEAHSSLMTNLNDLSIESGSQSQFLLRVILAAIVLIAIPAIGRGQGPLDPGPRFNEPQSPKQISGASSQSPPNTGPERYASAQQPAVAVARLTRDEA